MNRYTKRYLTCLIPYVLLLELFLFGTTNHWRVNDWLFGNCVVLLIGGAMGLFVATLLGLMENFWED